MQLYPINNLLRNILRLAVGSICALVIGLCLWSFRELVILLEDSIGTRLLYMPNYDNWLYIILFLGFPTGCFLGILSLNKRFYKLQVNKAGVIFGFLLSDLGILLIGVIVPKVISPIVLIEPIALFLLPLTASFFGLIGYNYSK